MSNIVVYFVGGSSISFRNCSIDLVEDLIKWLNDKDDTRLFKVRIPKLGRCKYLRKDLILSIDEDILPKMPKTEIECYKGTE